MSAAEIFEQIRELRPGEKRDLVERVMREFGDEVELFDDELTPWQTAELDRRLAEFEANPAKGTDWQDVKAEIQQRFGWKTG